MNVIHETRPDSRTRRRDETTERIVAAAARIAAEEGLEALTMQRLAGELGYRAGALYRYFPSKDALLTQLLLGVVVALDAEVRAAEDEAAALGAASPLAPIVLSARRYLRFAEERPAEMALLVRALAAPEPVIGGAGLPGHGPASLGLLGRAAAMFARAREAGALAPGEDLPRALLTWTSLHGLVGTRKLARFGPALASPLAPQALVDALLRALLVGFGAAPDAVDACLRSAGPANASANASTDAPRET